MKRAVRRLLELLSLRSRHPPEFHGTGAYWEERYSRGGTSGPGSEGRLARYKADFLNAFVRDNGVESVIELGCGDGRQLAMAEYPAYIGLDVSTTAVRQCRERLGEPDDVTLMVYDPTAFHDGLGRLRADLALSLDVLFHLVEDDVYETYLRHLFRAARDHVIIYSSDVDARPEVPHVRHRNFTADVDRWFPEWALRHHEPNPYPLESDPKRETFSDFHVYERA